MKPALIVMAAGIALSGCVAPYGSQPTMLNPSPYGGSGALPPPVPYSSAPYSSPSYLPPPPAALPSDQPLAGPAELPPPEDLPPVVFQPNAPLPQDNIVPESYGQSPTAPTASNPPPAAPVPTAAVAPPALPDKGGADVPMMGFRPMRGQKSPTTSAVP